MWKNRVNSSSHRRFQEVNQQIGHTVYENVNNENKCNEKMGLFLKFTNKKIMLKKIIQIFKDIYN